jgi:hypothetical protein
MPNLQLLFGTSLVKQCSDLRYDYAHKLLYFAQLCFDRIMSVFLAQHEFLAYPEGISVSGHETTWLENFCCSQQCANGKCSSVTRQCECYPGFSGPSCSIFSFNVTGPSDMRGVLLYHTSALQDFHCFDPSNGSTLKRLYVDTAPIDPSTLASRTPALVISEESLSYSGGSFFFPNATIQKYIGTTSPTTIYGVVADVHCYYDSATFQSDIPIFRVGMKSLASSLSMLTITLSAFLILLSRKKTRLQV